jgi:formate-dependent nitrite reductase membrane component NrfD
LIPFLASSLGWAEVSAFTSWASWGIALVFLLITTVLLVKDLDQPGRFIYVLLRPQWGSWLVRGGYALTIYGAMLSLWALAKWQGWSGLEQIVGWLAALSAVITAVYTAYLFAQAKGRDFWQSPMLSLHMLGHSVLAGASVAALLVFVSGASEDWLSLLSLIIGGSIVLNLLVMLVELTTPHSTGDAQITAHMIYGGRYKMAFWTRGILLGNLIPFALLFVGTPVFLGLAGVLALAGIYFIESIWVEAPQRIALS